MQGVCNRQGTETVSTERKACDGGARNTSGGLPLWLSGKEFTFSAREADLIPGLGRVPGEGKGTPLQYSGLENPMDRGAWWATVRGVAQSQTELSDCLFHFSSSLTSWDITSVPKQRVHQHYLLFCLIIFFPLKKLYTTVKASLEKSSLLLAFLQPMAIILYFSSLFIHYGDYLLKLIKSINTYLTKQGSFAQCQYCSQLNSSKVWLLLTEDFSQYPA